MSLIASLGAIEIGLIFGLVALGVFLSFRIINFPDLTVDGSFPLGGAGFPRLVRLIVGAGGDLVSCSSRSTTFEEAFHAVVEASEVDVKGGG